MNKKFVFTILFIGILSISFIQIDSIYGGLFDLDYDNHDESDILQGNYEINHDDEGIYNDIDYANVDYSTNTNNDPFNRFFFGDTVDIYFDGEGTTVSTNLDSDINYQASNEILNYVSKNILNSTTDVETRKEDIREICHKYGSIDCTVNIDSIIGEDQIPFIVWAQGESMLPTIQDGQYVLINKTHDIHVGDIVSVDSKEYGGIMKRVDKINGDNVYLVSDNKNIYYKEVNGTVYEYKGLCTWVDISEIEGVAIYY